MEDALKAAKGRRIKYRDMLDKGWFNSRQALHNAIHKRGFPRPRKRYPGRMQDAADWDEDECQRWIEVNAAFIEPEAAE